MIRLEAVSKRYGSLMALDSFTAQIGRGELVGLLGPNGAGKTTLMSILTGNLAPSSGTVLVGGHDLMLEPRQAKRMIGYLPEHVPLYDEMTVEAFLRFAAELRQVVPGDIRRHVADVARLTGLNEVLPRRIGNLSKGYRQRAGLAQALCGSPEALVLDEPTVGLDPLQAAEFRRLLLRLRQEHTILLSSHILSDLEGICDRVLIIRDGRLKKVFTREGGADDGAVRLHVRIAIGRDRLEKILRALPCVTGWTFSTAGEAGVQDAELLAEKDAPVERQLFAALSAADAPILHLSRRRSTLEEVFLEAMKETE